MRGELQFCVHCSDIARRPLYIRTTLAIYVLDEPSDAYLNIWDTFETPHRIAQLAITSVLDGTIEYHGSQEDIETVVKMHAHLSGELFDDSDFRKAVCLSLSALASALALIYL